MQAHTKILSTKKLSEKNIHLLESSGISVFQHNFIKTESILTDTDAALINKLGQQKLHVIFTSANAVKAVAEKLLFQPKWKIFCISGKTKATIEQLFLKAEIVADAANGQQLAEKIIAISDLKNILFFSGNKRMSTIPRALETAAINLQEIVVYATDLTPAEFQENFAAIIFFSPSAVESFFSVNKISKETILFSIGATTTKALGLFSANIIESAFPSEKEIVRTIKSMEPNF